MKKTQQAIPVQAGRAFGKTPVAIADTVYDRYVTWSRQAMERAGVAHDEQERLERLLNAAAYAAQQRAGGPFVLRALDATASEPRNERVVLDLRPVPDAPHPSWVITLTA